MSRLSAVVLGLVVALALGGCTRPNTPAKAGKPSGVFGGAEVELDASRWLEGDSKKAQAAGASESEVIAVQAGTPGDRIEGMVNVPEKSCVALIARGTATIEDIDLFVYSDDGTGYGSDEAPDKHPTLMVCPKRATRLYLVARVAQGHGLVAIGAQRVDEADAERVAQAIGARNRRGATSAEAWPGLEETVSRHRERVGGSWEDLRRVALPVDARVASNLTASVPAEQCLDVLVVPAEEVSHLDVLAKDTRGRIVGRARAAGRERSLIVCSAQEAQVTFEVRPHAGRGLAVIVVSKSAKGTEQDIDAPALRFDLTPPTSLAEGRAELSRQLESAGYGAGKIVAKGELKVGRRESERLKLPGGCSRLDVWGAEPMRGVEAWLWDEEGRLLAADKGGARATLFACAPAGTVRLDAEALVRPGQFEVELRQERETPKILEEHPLAAGRLLDRMLSRGVIKNAHQVGAPRTFDLATDRLSRMDVLVPIGRCVDVTLALDQGATGAEIRLIDKNSDEEIAMVRGSTSSSARACALDRPMTLDMVAEFRVTAGRATGLVATRMLAPRR